MLAVDHFVLEMDVSELVFQLCWVRAFDRLESLCKGYFQYKVIVKHLEIENTMVSQDLMVKADAILAPINFLQFVYSGDA